MSKKIAFFDVDGTIISVDSFRYLILSIVKQSPWRALLLLSAFPILLVTLMFSIDKQFAKSWILWILTFGKTKKIIVKEWSRVMASLARQSGFVEFPPIFDQLMREGCRVVFVSASGTFWIRALIRNLLPPGAKYSILGSRLGFCAGGVVVTSKNCYNLEKITRIETFLSNPGSHFELFSQKDCLAATKVDAEWVWSYGYSDHPADFPMLHRCHNRFFVSPKGKHLKKILLEFPNSQATILKWKTKN